MEPEAHPPRRKTARIRPAGERLAPDATRRGPALALSPSERETLYRMELAKKALYLLVEQSRSFPETAAELGLDPAALLEYADTLEFQAFKQAMAEKLAGMYLDPERAWRRAEMAEALGMTPKRFRNFIHSDIFRQVYEETLLRLTEDPGPRAVQAKIIEDLLPQAYRTLQWELSGEAPASVRQKARQDVFRLAGISETPTQASDRHEIAAFLAAQNVNLNLHLPLPPAYQEALTQYLPPLVAGEFAPTAENRDRPAESDPAAQSQ